MQTYNRPAYFHTEGDWHVLSGTFECFDKKLGEVFKIAPGFKWNMGSVPNAGQVFIPDGDEMTYPSLLHDLFYRGYFRDIVTRDHADRMLRQMLVKEFQLSGDWLGRVKAWSAWAAVRAGGKASWQSRKIIV